MVPEQKTLNDHRSLGALHSRLVRKITSSRELGHILPLALMIHRRNPVHEDGCWAAS
jgi:hypothetical protein